VPPESKIAAAYLSRLLEPPVSAAVEGGYNAAASDPR
jgi:hypothetical protein